MADIDASGTAAWNNGKGFAPLAESNSPYIPFTGEFDGNGYAIIDLTIDRPEQGGVGLFETTGETGIVRDVTLVNATVVGSYVTLSSG